MRYVRDAMNRLHRINNGMPEPRGPVLEVLKYRIQSFPYSKIRQVMAELGQSDTDMKRALKLGHGVTFSGPLDDGPVWVVFDSQQDAAMKRHGVANPTLLQLLGTARIFSRSRAEAERRFLAMFKDAEEEEPQS